MFLKLLLTPGPRYSWRKVLFILSASSFLSLIIAIPMYFFWYYEAKLGPIRALVQTGNELPPSFLAEVMNLSSDRPLFFNQFNLKQARNRLEATTIIKEVKIKKVKPDLLYIDYKMRQPIAYLGDWTNTLIDEEGYFFPSTPYYSPKNLVKIYLGEFASPNPWGKQMKESHKEMMHALLDLLKAYPITGIDLTQALDPSSGKRQIIVTLATKGERLLRLSPNNYAQQLANYFILEETTLKDEPLVIDLRIPEVAYLKLL